MADILIRGMEMPKDGYIDVRLFPDGLAYIQTGEPPYYRAFGAIELPPHGRLIDADATLLEAKRISGPMTGDGWSNWGVYALIERQPTVIPAEEE